MNLTIRGDVMAADNMNSGTDNIDIRRLMNELEHTIKITNSEKISEVAGDVSKDAFVNVAASVAQLRANYLSEVLKLQSGDDLSGEALSTLKELRSMYEEAMQGFSALQHALNRGYFSLVDG